MMKNQKTKEKVCNPPLEKLSLTQKWALTNLVLAKGDFCKPSKSAREHIIETGYDTAAVWIFSDSDRASGFISACDALNLPPEKVREWIQKEWVKERGFNGNNIHKTVNRNSGRSKVARHLKKKRR